MTIHRMVIGCIVVLLSACSLPAQTTRDGDDPQKTIRVDMDYPTALKILELAKAKEVDLDMAVGENGDYRCYELADNRLVCVIADKDKEKVVEIQVCSNPDKPKNQRIWKKVQKLTL